MMETGLFLLVNFTSFHPLEAILSAIETSVINTVKQQMRKPKLYWKNGQHQQRHAQQRGRTSRGQTDGGRIRKTGFQNGMGGVARFLAGSRAFSGYSARQEREKTGSDRALDTVFEKSLPMDPYTKINDSTATGQGVQDDKGGDIVLIAALKALHAHQLLDETSMTVYLTGDEEIGGGGFAESRRDFIERAKQCDIALCFEGGDLKTVTTGRRGGSFWTLSVKARSGHSSRIFAELGYGAVYEAVRIVNEFRRVLGQEHGLTFNPGLIAGGSKSNTMTKQARPKYSTVCVWMIALIRRRFTVLTEIKR
ncbi:MAG: M20/M25/M40 family metallo-hydrolase [Spirosomataceae bacterium]